MAEKDYYKIIKSTFENLFNEKGETSLTITANTPLSNDLKNKISGHRDIIFSFLKEARPDISGFIEKDSSNSIIVIEIKDEKIKLDHIYQAKKYANLLEATFAFLVSTIEIPEEIKKLSKVTLDLLDIGYYNKLVLCHFDKNKNEIVDWFEKNPFTDKYKWKQFA